MLPHEFHCPRCGTNWIGQMTQIKFVCHACNTTWDNTEPELIIFPKKVGQLFQRTEAQFVPAICWCCGREFYTGNLAKVHCSSCSVYERIL